MIYLIRHAQAGPRGNYDELSALGQQQARLLGQHLATQQMQFDTIYTGTLQRQQNTAQIVQEQLSAAIPIITDQRWNEFQLAPIYQSMAQHLCGESESFARDFAVMKTMLSENPYAMSGAISRCDRTVMKAWVMNRYPANGYEAWPAFQYRVQAVFAELAQHSSQENIAVFTSATPIAIAVGAALQLVEEKALELAWVMYNTGLTTLKYREATCTLYTLNTTPHLLAEETKTFR
ncbi:MAG: histidine phosphatase family protein [Blastocatellia bacterium]